MEPVAPADSADVDELAAVAASTFPLACPPSVTAENMASFIEANLSAARFAEYLADPRRVVLVARHDERIVGYAMLVRDDGVELSKMYVLPEHHGAGVSTALMNAAIELSDGRVWLGVNQKNQRAQCFYAKHGFRVNGTRIFRVGAGVEHDYIMVREL
ncbi:GNAT family N-acetyltransferase [Mycobacterium branderi]|uniref:N-acetyltransferase n=1 Tax=Mycobacterium branderi TaxID=43348 RepID=A0A7I7W9W5_9MYCO|nr:GNAT family N-acetyltransferase [Mycobacterium branderi]MCV7232272.1 GNAT family N-acetyltransferase [Mycobacterium branderi]ORA36143.1 GNAT family N-acetyltransferase [Mycobacterium branderi]BBZ14294.1 putative N-acetyltransferase [Mycobacterium branderi]